MANTPNVKRKLKGSNNVNVARELPPHLVKKRLPVQSILWLSSTTSFYGWYQMSNNNLWLASPKGCSRQMVVLWFPLKKTWAGGEFSSSSSLLWQHTQSSKKVMKIHFFSSMSRFFWQHLQAAVVCSFWTNYKAEAKREGMKASSGRCGS